MRKVYLIVSMTFPLMIYAHVYNVLDYGAVADSVTFNTIAIQSAIDECSKNNGGTVYVPPGRYLTSTLELKDNVELNLAPTAELLGPLSVDDYAEDIPMPNEELKFRHVLVFAKDAENVTISGGGTINGRGFRKYFRGIRPSLLRFIECRNLEIKDVTLKNPASWCCPLFECEDVYIHGITIYGHANSNNDGIDPDGCKNVIISDCIIDCIDDAICPKSSKKATENVAVTNCIVSSECAGFKLGTASRHGFKNITISNCVFHKCRQGVFKILIMDGAYTENVNISDCVLDDVEGPIFIRLGNRARDYEKLVDQNYDMNPEGPESKDVPVGSINGLSISNIRGTVVSTRDSYEGMRVDGIPGFTSGVMITGIPGHTINNLRLNNIHVDFPGLGIVEDTERVVPEQEYTYPEQRFFGVLPSYGMFIRHVDGLVMDNISLTYRGEEHRPPIVCDDVKNLEVYKLRARPSFQKDYIIRMENVDDAFINTSRSLEAVDYFIGAVENVKNIKLVNNDFSRVRKGMISGNYERKEIQAIGNVPVRIEN